MCNKYIGPYKDVGPLYIEYKRSLGYDAISEEGALRRMDKFFYNRGITDVKLTKEMVEEYGKRRENESIDTQRSRLTLMKQFAIFLLNLGYTDVYVHNIKLGKDEKKFRPYIYSKEDIKKIIDYIDLHQNDNKSINDFVLPIYIRLLYGCGLRRGELDNLLTKNVDYNQKIIKIVDGKGHVTRIVPLSNSLWDACIKYRNKLPIKSKYFICDLKGNKVSKHITKYFQKILIKLNILRPDGTLPRLHDFRFTFSINALNQMEERGQDLYTTLSILSRYLGHKNISATEHYLILAKDYFINIRNKEEEYYSDLLKMEESDE